MFDYPPKPLAKQAANSVKRVMFAIRTDWWRKRADNLIECVSISVGSISEHQSEDTLQFVVTNTLGFFASSGQ